MALSGGQAHFKVHVLNITIKGRFIGENIRLTNDIIYECEVQKKDCLISLVDFSKAVDVISGDVIDTALEVFGFGEDTKQ